MAASTLASAGAVRAADETAEPIDVSRNVVELGAVLATLDASHPLLDATAREREIAEGDVESAEGAFDVAWRTRGTVVPLGGYPSARVDTLLEVPTEWWGLTLFGGYRFGTDSFASYDGKLETNEYGEVRAGAALPLWRNGPIDRRRANIRRAEIGVELAELAVAERRIELVRLATVRYWEWAAAGARLRVARAALDVAEARDAQLAARVDAGDVPEIDRLENARAILQRRQQVAAAERALTQAALELSLYHRDARGRPIVPTERDLPATLPRPSEMPAADDPVSSALGRRPEVTRLRGIREQAAVEREWAGNQRAPAIDFTVVGSQDFGDGDAKRGPFELELSLVVDIPLERNVAHGRVKAADAQVARADAQARFAAEQIGMQVMDARNAVDIAKSRHALAVAEVEIARKLELAERDKLELGDSSVLVVNLREQTALEAALREVDTLLDYHRARAAFDAAMGTNANPKRVPKR